MNNKKTLLALAFAGVWASPQAAVMYDIAGDLSGITGVAVTAVNAAWGSTGPADPVTRMFDVEFRYGTYPSVFGGSGLPLAWELDSAGLATAAMYGLVEAIDNAGIPGTQRFAGASAEALIPYFVGIVPSATSGCTTPCAASRWVFYWDLIGSWQESIGTYFVFPDEMRSWALFTPARIEGPGNGVPEPNGLALLLAALLPMAWLRRR